MPSNPFKRIKIVVEYNDRKKPPIITEIPGCAVEQLNWILPAFEEPEWATKARGEVVVKKYPGPLKYLILAYDIIKKEKYDSNKLQTATKID